jgi:hypothetical protein
MSEKTERPGLGKIIYSVDDAKHAQEPKANKAEEREVQVEEAVEESFPASDPPGFAKGSATDAR